MQKQKPTCALVIATYNWPKALRLCLESVLRQTVLPNEIIIADDGSGEDTQFLVEHYQHLFGVPVIHVWQPDEGYQLSRIRNKAFSALKSQYVIQIDGDLILHPQFIADHLAAARPNKFISGTRALLNETATQKILAGKSFSHPINIQTTGKPYNAIRSRHLSTVLRLFQRSKKNLHFVLGCNMAFWKTDLQKVNGYNEAFVGWGKEDNDIAARLLNAGVALRFLKFGGVVYHLHHPLQQRPALGSNENLLSQSLEKKITYVEQGMDKHKAEN